MKDKIQLTNDIKRPIANINKYFSFNKSQFDSRNRKEVLEKDTIIKKIISNADDETDSVSNSEISFNFSQTISDENSAHSMKISKHSFVDSILTLPSQTYRNYRAEKSSDRKDSARVFQMKSPPTSGNKELYTRRGQNTDRISVENSKYTNNNDFNATDSMLYNNNKGTKRELTERSIFYTPSTICNYYQQSNEVTPNKNITDSNNKTSDRQLIHKFKLNFKNLNLINITSNNNCNTSNTNSNFYDENITENNENISSSSRFNIHTFEKRTPIKYIKSQKNCNENKSKVKEEKSLSNLNPFNLESSPSVASNNFKKHLNISSIEIEDRSIDINEEMMKENNKSRYYIENSKNHFEKKNLISAFDQIKIDENKKKETTEKIGNNFTIVNNTNNINLNIIRNENFSFDMTNKAVNFIYNNNSQVNRINNNNDSDAIGNIMKNGDSNFNSIRNTATNNSNNSTNEIRNENGSNSVKSKKGANKFEYRTVLAKSNKNQTLTLNKVTTPIIKSLKDTTKQYYSLKTTHKSNTADNLISTAMPSSNKSQQSSINKFKEVRAFDDVSDYETHQINKEKSKSKGMNINLSKVNITNNLFKQFATSKNKPNPYSKNILTEPSKRTDQSKSPSSFNDKKLTVLSKPITSPFDNMNNYNSVNSNKYKPVSQTVKTKNNINSVDSKSKNNYQGNKTRISPSIINRTNLPDSSTIIKKIINENIANKSLAKTNQVTKKIQELKEKKNLEKSIDNAIRQTTNESKITVIEDNNNSRQIINKTTILKDESKNVITDFSHYKKSNRDYFEYIPKKVLMKDACLQTSPCKTMEDEFNFKKSNIDSKINEKKLDKLDLRVNKQIIFSKLNKIRGDEDNDFIDDYE